MSVLHMRTFIVPRFNYILLPTYLYDYIVIYHTCFIHSNYFVSDIDTDELDSDDKNVQVEKVEFLVKEEVTVID